MSSSGSGVGDHSKKRRVDNGGGVSTSTAVGHELAGDDGSLVAPDLMSVMNQLLEQNRKQTAIMASLQEEVKCIREELGNVRRKMDNMEKNTTVETNSIAEAKHEMKTMSESLHALRSSNDMRFDHVDNKQKYLEVMMKNQKWEYSASIPSEDSIGAPARELLEDMKELTCNMRYGDDDTADGHVSILDYDNNPHQADFLPHWEEFSNALREYQYTLRCFPKDAASSLVIRGVELAPSMIAILSNGLESTHFKSFTLDRNNFGEEGIDFAMKHVRDNPILEEFHLRNNSFMSNDKIDQFCEIIQGHTSIHRIELIRCCGEDMNGHDMLRSIVTAGGSKLKWLNLSGNTISTGGSTFIADFLSANPFLQDLILYRNRLVDADAYAIADALKNNTNLKYLDITGNSLGGAGIKMMRKAEFDSTSLNSVACSNHTCYIEDYSLFNMMLDEDQYTDDQVIEASSKASRQKKIYSLLSARHRECSNVEYFHDIPVGLLPDVLSTIQQNSRYHEGENAPDQDDEHPNSLSIVYEVARTWDKALSVYESLSCFL